MHLPQQRRGTQRGRAGRSWLARLGLRPLLAAWSGAGLVGLAYLGWAAAAEPNTLPQEPQPTLPAGPGDTAPLDGPASLLPAPRLLDAPQSELPGCAAAGGRGAVLGGVPRPNAEVLREFNQFIDRTIDPENVLDLIVGRPRLLIFKESPRRIQIAEPPRAAQGGAGARAGGAAGGRIASFTLITEKELSLMGEAPGTSVLNLWFDDPKDPTRQKILSYLLRVFPDQSVRDQRERAYKLLEAEINHTFPDSSVCLSLVGQKLVVSGQARDIAEAAHILNLVQAAAPRTPETTEEPAPTPGTPGTETTTTTGVGFGLLGAQSQTTQTTQPLARQGARGPVVINLLRVPGEQQVMLRVVVAEVNRAAARSIGVNFAITNNSGITVFAQNTGGIAGASLATGAANGMNTSTAANNLPAALSGGQIALAINALRTLSYARSLAEPNLVTLDGQPASFQAGGAFPVPVVSGFTAAGLQGVQYIPFGVQVAFTPFITDRDRIRLQVQANISTRDLTTVNVSGSQVPTNLNTRNFQTVVELREGQTLAVAGLIQNNLAAQADRVPWLGDLPFIGRFAAFDRTQNADQELVMLVTPELVHPLNPKEVPPLPGSDIFEPSDLEFYLFARLESRRNYDFRSPVRTDVNRLIRYRRCEDIYITGPHGHADGHH